MVRDGITRYVENVRADLFVLAQGELVLPLAVVDGCYDNSLVASPYSMYVTLTKHELRTLPHRGLRALITGALALFSVLFKVCRFNRVALVNGHPLSTALYPSLGEDDILAVRSALIEAFPNHAVVFRSIDGSLGEEVVRSFAQQGFRLVYHRPTYGMNPTRADFRMTSALHRDFKLFEKTDYELVSAAELTDSDIKRITELFRQLYIARHTPLNPQYTERFFRMVVRDRVLDVVALKKDGRVDGFIAFQDDGRQLTDPFLGYDTSLPQKLGLYRMLVALVVKRAREKGLSINYSAGVGEFKKRRGCKLTIEYIAVYDRHLPWHRRLPWMLLQSMNRVAVAIMRRVDF